MGNRRRRGRCRGTLRGRCRGIWSCRASVLIAHPDAVSIVSAERLDQMLIQAVNVRVECLARMKDGLEQTFERGLIESGYKP